MMAQLGMLVLAVASTWSAASSQGLPGAGQHSLPPADSNARNDPASAADHARTRGVIQQVLAQREFADLHADPYAFARQLREWLFSVLERIASALGRLPRWLFWTLLVWMILTLLAILAHLIYTLVMLLRGGRRLSTGAPAHGRPGELLGIRDLDFDTVYAEARRLLAVRDWPAATRYLYVSAILWLDRKGAIAFRLSKTNRDYLDELAARSWLQNPFHRLTTCFESIVYGGQPSTVSTSQDMARTVESLLHAPAGVIAG